MNLCGILSEAKRFVPSLEKKSHAQSFVLVYLKINVSGQD